jgi:hypothetical protein
MSELFLHRTRHLRLLMLLSALVVALGLGACGSDYDSPSCDSGEHLDSEGFCVPNTTG